MLGTTPTKTGEVREDRFWLLKSCRHWNYYDAQAGTAVEPITDEPVSLDVYRMSESKLRLHALLQRATIHGRRINDEVELFEWDEGKETPGLREALEAKGLTVRTYVPQSDGKARKFPRPGVKATLGKDVEEPTATEQGIWCLKEAIKETGRRDEVAVDYAILADSGKVSNTGRNVLLLFRFEEQDFYIRPGQESSSFAFRGQKFPIIAELECGDLRLACAEDKFASFFEVRLRGARHVTLSLKDVSEEYERARREAVKAEKKRAKKHRRTMTASTITTPSEQSTASTLQEDNEEIKAHQREKNKAKKKAQKKRKKLKSGLEQAQLATQEADLEDEDDEEEGEMEVFGTTEDSIVLKTKNGRYLMRPKDASR